MLWGYDKSTWLFHKIKLEHLFVILYLISEKRYYFFKRSTIVLPEERLYYIEPILYQNILHNQDPSNILNLRFCWINRKQMFGEFLIYMLLILYLLKNTNHTKSYERKNISPKETSLEL